MSHTRWNPFLAIHSDRLNSALSCPIFNLARLWNFIWRTSSLSIICWHFANISHFYILLFWTSPGQFAKSIIHGSIWFHSHTVFSTFFEFVYIITTYCTLLHELLCNRTLIRWWQVEFKVYGPCNRSTRSIEVLFRAENSKPHIFLRNLYLT